jgi:hypothetical protein
VNVTKIEQLPPVQTAGAMEKSVPVYTEKLVLPGTPANVTVCCPVLPTATDPKFVGAGACANNAPASTNNAAPLKNRREN